MPQSRLFNSPFEMSLRILLLLSVTPEKSCTADKIIGLDFITCYAADFGLPFTNLHGENNYKYGEIAGRRMLATEAIKGLVTSGLLEVSVERGYLFSVSEQGRKYVDGLKSTYATEYRKIAKMSTDKYMDNTDAEILALIQMHSICSLKG